MRRSALAALVLGVMGGVLAPPLVAEVQVLKETPSTYVYPVDGHIPFNIHRGTPTLLSLMLPGTSFQDPQGVCCALLKSTDDPKDPLDDVELTVLGMNSAAGELFYNVGLRTLKKMGTAGKGAQQFQKPMGVALHPSGVAAVADTGNHRLVLLQHDGYRLTWVRSVGRRGARAGEFDSPFGVAFDSLGNLYVTDRGNHRLQRMDKKGAWTILPIQGLESPTGLAVIDRADPWTFYTTGVYADRLAVIDRGGARLQTFTLEGHLLSVYAAAEGEVPLDLRYCAFDYFGHLVATDGKKGALRKFDRDLKPLAVFGESGEGDYQFQDPRGVCLNKQLGQMVVAERSSVQYLWVGADALHLRAEAGSMSVTFRFYLTEPAYLTAEVRGEGGTKKYVVADNIMMDERERALVWTPPEGTPAGDYRLTLSVMATYSSRDRLAKRLSLPFTLDPTEGAAFLPPEKVDDEKGTTSENGKTLGQALSEVRKAKAWTPTPTPTPERTLGQALQAERATAAGL